MRISLCMIACDELRMLPDCLKSAGGVVDEVVIVDTGSRDGTPELARSLGAMVYSHRWRNDFADARNASLDRATGDWILVLDCDERLEAETVARIRAAAAEGKHEGYLVQMVNQREDGSAGERWLALRLFRNRGDRRYRGRVHEQLRFEGSVGVCGAVVRHLGYQAGEIAARNKATRNQRLLEAALSDPTETPEDLSRYLLHWAFAVTGAERAQRMERWVRYADAHPRLQQRPVHPWIPVGLAHYAWQLSDAGQHAEAQARAWRLLQSYGESPLLRLVLGRAAASARDYGLAREHLAKAEACEAAGPFSYFPLDYEKIRRRARRVLAEVYEREGKLAEAERIYLQLVEADGDDLHAALRLACVRAQTGAYREALQTLESSGLAGQGLPEIDCLGLAMALIAPAPEKVDAWLARVVAWSERSPLASTVLLRAGRRPGAGFHLSDFPELQEGIRLRA